MTGAKLDPDLARILQIAGVNPVEATDRQIALADHMHMRYPNNPRKAGMELLFYFKGGGR